MNTIRTVTRLRLATNRKPRQCVGGGDVRTLDLGTASKGTSVNLRTDLRLGPDAAFNHPATEFEDAANIGIHASPTVAWFIPLQRMNSDHARLLHQTKTPMLLMLTAYRQLPLGQCLFW